MVAPRPLPRLSLAAALLLIAGCASTGEVPAPAMPPATPGIVPLTVEQDGEIADDPAAAGGASISG